MFLEILEDFQNELQRFNQQWNSSEFLFFTYRLLQEIKSKTSPNIIKNWTLLKSEIPENIKLLMESETVLLINELHGDKYLNSEGVLSEFKDFWIFNYFEETQRFSVRNSKLRKLFSLKSNKTHQNFAIQNSTFFWKIEILSNDSIRMKTDENNKDEYLCVESDKVFLKENIEDEASCSWKIVHEKDPGGNACKLKQLICKTNFKTFH